MEKRHMLFAAVVLSVLVAGTVGYGACVMDLDDGTGILGEVPPMPDAGMPNLPPELDDPPIDREGIDRGMPGERGEPGPMPGDPIRPQPEDDDPGVNMDMPDDVSANDRDLAGRTVCGAGMCAADERCCVSEGQCYPVTCDDCCSQEDRPRPTPGVLDPPVIDPAAH
ncbi:MAG: hypothetical protein H6719_19360 [Sandaracinaceae bacterium]|nr:hypothetical protein [Sandaracinaceae bacterium]